MEITEMTYSEIKKELYFHKSKAIEYHNELLRRERLIETSTRDKWINILNEENKIRDNFLSRLKNKIINL
jgi:hypothetical protein